MTQFDYLRAAFRMQYNLILLAGAVAFALVSWSLLPVILFAGLELIYLSTIPNWPRFQRLVRSQQSLDERATLYNELPAEMRNRYADLVQIAKGVRENYRNLVQMDDKLDGLMRGYLRLLHAAAVQRQHLQLSSPGEIARQIANLEAGLAQDGEKVKEINEKRLDILRKRLEKFDRIRENRQIIDAQCAAIEDVLKLVRDQSVTLRDSDQLSVQLDTLVTDVETTEQTVRQVEALFQSGEDLWQH